MHVAERHCLSQQRMSTPYLPCPACHLAALTGSAGAVGSVLCISDALLSWGTGEAALQVEELLTGVGTGPHHALVCSRNASGSDTSQTSSIWLEG